MKPLITRIHRYSGSDSEDAAVRPRTSVVQLTRIHVGLNLVDRMEATSVSPAVTLDVRLRPERTLKSSAFGFFSSPPQRSRRPPRLAPVLLSKRRVHWGSEDVSGILTDSAARLSLAVSAP